MSYDSSNIFAKILRGEIPSHKVFETEHCVAILDAFPMAEGHSLLLPKAPCISVLDMSADVAAHVLSQLPRLARLVQAATGAPGVNILQNSGAVAGQVVFHCHFHVIPRFEGDKAVAWKKKLEEPTKQPLLEAYAERASEPLMDVGGSLCVDTSTHHFLRSVRYW